MKIQEKVVKLNESISQLSLSVLFDVKWVVSEKNEVVITSDNPEVFNHIEINQSDERLEIVNVGHFIIKTNKANIYSGRVQVNQGVIVGDNNTGNVCGGNMTISQNNVIGGNFIGNITGASIKNISQNSGTVSGDEEIKFIVAETVNVIVYAPSFSHIVLTGTGEFVATDIKQKAIVVRLFGAGVAKLKGAVEQLTVTVEGAGKIKAKRLITESANLHVSGVGELKSTVNKEVSASVSGVGSIHVYGRPATVNKKVSGVGSIKMKGKINK